MNKIKFIILAGILILSGSLSYSAEASNSVKTSLDETKDKGVRGQKSLGQGTTGQINVSLRRKQISKELETKYPNIESRKKEIIKLLGEKDIDKNLVAISLSGQLKIREAVPKLITQLKHEKSEVKIAAASSLGVIGDERAIDPLLEAPELIVLEFGYCPVSNIGASALPKLVNLAKKKNLLGMLPKQEQKDQRSRKAAYAIGKIRDEKAIPGLMKLLKDEDSDVRLAAVQSLAAMKAKDAEPEFEKMLKDKTTEIRSETIKALMDGNKDKYYPKTIEMLGSRDTFDVFTAAEILGELKDNDAIPYLEKLLVNEDGDIRQYAAIALWRISGKVYKYKKTKKIESRDDSDKRMINAMLKRGESKAFIESFYKEKQSQGYLWEYSTIDDLLEEIKTSGDKYEYK